MVLTDTAIRAAKPRQKSFKMYDRGRSFLQVNPVSLQFSFCWASICVLRSAIGSAPLASIFRRVK